MKIFIFDYPDSMIRRALLALLGDDLYRFRPLQSLLSTGWHVISFYLALTTVVMVVYNLIKLLW